MAKTAEGPSFLRFVIPILETLKELGGSGAAADVTDSVVARMAIPKEEEDVINKNGQSRVRNQIHWARFYLVQAGYLGSAKRGVWKLTDTGRNAKLDRGAVFTLFKDVHEGFDDEDEPEEQAPVLAHKFGGPRALFSDRPFSMNELLTYIDIGDLGLPDIQRPFVWKTTKVRDLLDSMFRG